MLRYITLPRVSLALLAAAAIMLAMASIAPAGAQAGSGRVRVMHASPDTPAVDIYVDDQKAVTALAFPADTGYVSLPAGSHNVKVFVSPSDGTGTPALEADLAVAAGKDYTVLAVGLVGDRSLALLPLEDNNASPAAGNAHIRLIHASPDAPAVDVVVAGTSTKVFSNVAFKGTGAHAPVPAGTYNLDVRPAGTETVALSISGLDLKDRGVYTAVAIGRLSDSSLKVVALVDAPPPAPHSPNTGTGLVTDRGGASWWMLAGLAAVMIAMAAGAGSVLARRSHRA